MMSKMETPKASALELRQMVDFMLESESDYSMRSLKDRKKDLQQLEKALLVNKQRIRDAVHADFKKPALEADYTELYLSLSEIRYAVRNLSTWGKPRRVSSRLAIFGTRSFVLPEPKGLSLIIAPWNFPLLLCMSPLASALAAGCQVVIKPSEHTPHTSRLIREIIESTFPREQVAVIQGGIETGKNLLELPFRHVFFTGSPGVGQEVYRAASSHFASVTLELGGKSPVIIHPPVNLKEAVRRILWGKWLNAGQTCVAPDYVLIHHSLEADFYKLARQEMERILSDQRSIGKYTAIIHSKHLERLLSMRDEAVSKGAQVVFERKESAPGTLYPVLLSNVPDECEVWKTELFGPILPIRTYQHEQEAFEFIRKLPPALSLYGFTKSRSMKQKILLNTKAGTTAINEVLAQFYHPDLPFGGIGQSGIGKAHGKSGFEAFTNYRSVLTRSFRPNWFSLISLPYTRTKEKIADIVIRWL